jgi:precorrin-6x reductase
VALAIPIVMVSRPPLPECVATAGSVDEAVEWVAQNVRMGNGAG